MALRKYFYPLVTIFLFFVFTYFAFESWDKFKQERISTNVREEFMKNFVYPSITVCPEKTFKTKIEIPTKEPLETIKQFYLDNVRNIRKVSFKDMRFIASFKTCCSEVFFFVNHRTWSRDGHKCMTGAVSEDAGRPCVFPFTFENKTHDKCIVPST